MGPLSHWSMGWRNPTSIAVGFSVFISVFRSVVRRNAGRVLATAMGLIVYVSTARAVESATATDAAAPQTEWVERSWHPEDGLPQDSVNAIVQTQDGFLWVGTSAGLARFDGVRFRKFGLQDG